MERNCLSQVRGGVVVVVVVCVCVAGGGGAKASGAGPSAGPLYTTPYIQYIPYSIYPIYTHIHTGAYLYS